MKIASACRYTFHVLLQATDSRDALAKAIYSNLFDWLVGRVNNSLEVGKTLTGRSISILDIYGFESFEVTFFRSLYYILRSS